MYDVMATTRVGRSRREMRSSKEEDEDFYWSPERHRTIDREEAAGAGPGAGPRASRRRLPLLRLPDRRRPAGADGPRRGRALRRGDAERRRGHRGGSPPANGAAASPSPRPSRASASRSRRTTSSTRPGSGRTGSGREEVHRGGGRAADRAQPRHPPADRPRPTCRSGAPPASCRPARGGRSSPCPGTGGPWSAPPTTTTRATSPTRSRPRTTSPTCSTRSTPSSAPRSGEADIIGAYAGVRPLISTGDPRKSVDISRRAELYETSLRDADDHRRQADHLAADGEADRRPAGRARGARGAVPHRGDPARDGGAAGRTSRRRRGWGRRRSRQLAFRYGHAARTVLGLAGRAARSWRRRSSRGCPDLLAEVVVATRLEQARSVADVLLRRTRLGLLAAPELRDRGIRAAGRRGDGRGAGLVGGRGSRPRRRPGWGWRRPRGSTRPVGDAAGQRAILKA